MLRVEVKTQRNFWIETNIYKGNMIKSKWILIKLALFIVVNA